MKQKIMTFTVLIGMGIAILVFSMTGMTNHAAESQTEDTDETSEKTAFSINQKSGFYSSNLDIEASVSGSSARIYYTTDCSDPDSQSGTSKLYHTAIPLEAAQQEKVYTLKFRYYIGNTASKVYTHTYIMGKNVKNRYNTTVVSITGSEAGLFGYESGIFEKGKLRDDYLKSNPDVSANDVSPDAAANYNLRGMGSERKVTLQMFDSKGDSEITQDCGLRIFGNFSRAKSQKSFQLFARTSYSTNGNFHMILSPETTKDSDGTILNRINRLVFRNSGDDFNHAFIRDTFLQSLASQAGYPYAYQDIPAAVYLNNTYYGTYWVREPFSSGYMKNRYGDFSGEFVSMSVNDYTMKTVPEADTEEQAELQTYSDEFQKIYDTYCNKDLTDNSNFEALSKVIDVDNYLEYYAIELYIGNKDWPYNNMKVYRYTDPDGKYTANSVFDGRYRYLLFDTDYSFGLINDYKSYTYDEDNIAIVTTNNQSPLFGNLMYRTDCRATLINDLCDLMNGSFSYKNASAVLKSLDGERKSELEYFLTHSNLPAAGLTITDVEKEVNNLDTFAKNRPVYMLQFIQKDFPVSHPYTISLSVPEDAQVSVGTITDVGTEFSGTYFADCGLHLKAKVKEGHTFTGWLINGKKYDSADLQLSAEELENLIKTSEKSADQKASAMGTLKVQMMETDQENALPVISMIHSKGNNDEIILYNPSGHTISTKNYYLSDSVNHLKKFIIPAETIKSEDTMTLYGKKNETKESLGKYRLPFSLGEGDTLILSDKEGNELEKIAIPKMSESDSWYVRNLLTGTYTEQEIGSK